MEPRAFFDAGPNVVPVLPTGPLVQRREIVRTAPYHSHPHWQRTEWLRWGFSIRFLHTAHNLIHITLLPIRLGDRPPRETFSAVYRSSQGKLALIWLFPDFALNTPYSGALDGCLLRLSISATQMEICSSFFRCCLILHNQNWELSAGVAGTKFTNQFKGR